MDQPGRLPVTASQQQQAATSSSSSSSSKIIKLNIGGVLFCTTSSTLLGRGENFFTALLSGRFAASMDENGAYFIDRNGRTFEPLLDYLRTGTLIIPPTIPMESVLIEASFFLIDISRALSGMFQQGLIVASSVAGLEPALLFMETDPNNPLMVAVTGVMEGYLLFDHVCTIDQGKLVLRIPGKEYHLQPVGS